MLTSDAFTAAMENLSKNRGSPGEWFAHRADYREPTRHPRIRPESVGIVERNQPHISMAALAGFEDRPQIKVESYEEFGVVPRDYTDQPIIRRVRTFEAELIARKSQSQSDRWYDFEGNQTYQPPRRPPRIGAGSDGKEIMESMTKKADWSSQDATGNESKTRPTQGLHAESAYRRRNEENSWFTHKSANNRDLTSQNFGKAHSRVRYEGVENAEKNQGTADILHMVTTDPILNGVPYGCPTTEAQYNSRWAKMGSDMAMCLGRPPQVKDDECESSELRPRASKVRGSDAEEWRDRGKRGHEFFGAQKIVESRPATASRTRPEAQDILNKATSGAQILNCLRMTNTSRVGMSDSPEPPVIPRIRSEEAEQAMMRNRGQMSQYLGRGAHSVTKPCGRKIHPRGIVSAESREVALRATGEAAKELLSHDKLPPEPVRSGFAPMSEEVRENAHRNQKGLIGGLLGGNSDELSSIALVGVEAPAPRRLHYEAVEYALKSRGDRMSELLKFS
ncbi:hypothetical protein CSKR_104702 [Clonorchis sinensis]|uniref:Uncharacterized protein n=1 Tax=Clonorchis sinensis TaxID=79923 RepID=A0A8T1MJR0_CLOSI|nr:hypothetical protein CSKR_104702 [Clonorchis sinensis]